MLDLIKQHQGIQWIEKSIRDTSPEDTLKKIRPLFSKIGITRLANVTGLDCIGIPVAMCTRPNAKHLSVSQGKGISWELAQISAIMETIEAYHAENIRTPDLFGTYASLRENYSLLNPDKLPKGNLTADKKLFPQSWLAAIDLNSQNLIYVPYGFIYLNSTQLLPEQALFNVSSTGLAAGNTLEEAICHGLYEIIERATVAHWRELPSVIRARTCIKLETINSGINQELLSLFHKVKVKVKIWEIPSKIAIPTYYCAISDPNNLRGIGAFSGSGTHLSKEVALTRALMEAAQTRLTFICGSRDDLFSSQYEAARNAVISWKNNNDETVFFDAMPETPLPSNCSDCIKTIKDRLHTIGLQQIIVVNHTKPELNVPVAHVVVPGII